MLSLCPSKKTEFVDIACYGSEKKLIDLSFYCNSGNIGRTGCQETLGCGTSPHQLRSPD